MEGNVAPGKEITFKNQNSTEGAKPLSIDQPQTKISKLKDGTQQTVHYSAGRLETEVQEKRDGSKSAKQYALNGMLKREETVAKDGSRAITTQEMGRSGPRAEQTVHFDKHGREISKTVVVKNTTIVNNKMTVVSNTRYYDRGHFGYVYVPVLKVGPLWHDPFWFGPHVIFHPFRYSWNWEAYPWYHHYYGPYWVGYDVYPTPAYWVTDWMIAAYVADYWTGSVSVAQAQEEVRLAREEAEQAKQEALQAEKARDEVLLQKAEATRDQAERRAKMAEERAARAERQEASGRDPKPNATPLNNEIKEEFRAQVEATIVENKQLAESEKTGQAILPDLSKSLADPNHIYPVSKTLGVISAKDQTAAGTISEGDLLKLEPGQDVSHATETTFVIMRVMTSKGEEGEVIAGTLISIPLRDLQEFDNEFRAKLDQGMQQAEKNKRAFKQAAQQAKN